MLSAPHSLIARLDTHHFATRQSCPREVRLPAYLSTYKHRDKDFGSHIMTQTWLVDQLSRRLVAAEEVRHNLALGNHQDLVGTGDGVLVVDGERCVSQGDRRTCPLLAVQTG